MSEFYPITPKKKISVISIFSIGNVEIERDFDFRKRKIYTSITQASKARLTFLSNQKIVTTRIQFEFDVPAVFLYPPSII